MAPQGCKGSKQAAQDKDSSYSSKLRKIKNTSSTQMCKSTLGTRVTIGSAFSSWRKLKAAKGLKTDAEVALCLLDIMKRLPSSPTSSEASDKRIKISQSEVAMLIEQEVCCAMKKNETKLKDLIEAIEKLDQGIDYVQSIQKLEARINTVTKRAEAAFASLTQKKSPHPSLVDSDIISTVSADKTIDTKPQIDKNSLDCMDKDGELFQMMETTKKALEKMHAYNKDVTGAIADLKEGIPPSCGSPECKGSARFPEPQHEKQNENNIEDFKESEEPKKTAKLNSFFLYSDIPEHTDSEQNKLSFPPLPATTFPSILNMEAASYNIPQKPEVRLGLIKDPPRLSVLWKVKEEDPSAPPMQSYSIYMATERKKKSGVFPKWSMIGEVRAISLPMCVLINKYKPGYKVCVTVVGKDKFGRYGPYSEVVTATIPD